ncbi:MAG TPA: glycerophosphodiester phosphodiesterase family protein [Polyangiaceae bacterium]|nr:glycerophosphodiester phosphodiesterase family protein [Polyangiaceae bacterium]
MRAARFKRDPGQPAKVLGHRGARHAAPENTLAAFELARAEGAAGVELDVRIDAEGTVIVLHDPTLTRVTAGACSAHVEDLKRADWAALDVGKGEKVPLLVDVLDWAKRHDLCVNVEVKADVRNRRRLLSAVVQCLAPRAAESERLLLSCFHPGIVWHLAKHLPDFGVNWLVHDRQPLLGRAPAFRRLGALGVNPQHTLLSVSSVERWKAAGALLCTWTVNSPELALAYDHFGVDVIISDEPGRVLSALRG